MPGRRALLSALATLPAAGLLSVGPLAAGASRYEPQLTEDGLYSQPWFLQTFLDMGEDHAEAAAEGKRFAVIWEQKGCPYCQEMHTVNLARPDVNDYVREHYAIVQLNLWGSREVTDFDGTAMEEREMARRWRVNFTPTIQFFPASADGLDGKSAVDLEVARMPGYFKPFHFLSMFEFVRAEAYTTTNFQRYLQEKLEALKEKGVDPSVW